MNLYVQMSDAEYEEFKEFKKAPKLINHSCADLASALLTVIRQEGGHIDIKQLDPFGKQVATIAKLTNPNFTLSLAIERYS